jgi:hypothetical protein
MVGGGEVTSGSLAVVNPLGAALDHYLDEIVAVVEPSGRTVHAEIVLEPSASGRGGTRWLIDYIRVLARMRRRPSDEPLLALWPVLGYLDFILIRVLVGRRRSWVVMHDPSPLVHARGYGRVARFLASRRWVASRILVHSEAAARVVRQQVQPVDIATVAHPMLAPTAQGGPRSGVCVVRVLGQYKPDRDVDALARLADVGPPDWRYEIVGRGWPEVPGWTVDQRFVPEDEFDELIVQSSVVLIPYLRFFQSGVAIRSLELGTPVVGPAESSLADLLGAESPWLVREGRWLDAVRSAVGARSETSELAAHAYARVVASWGAWSP